MIIRLIITAAATMLTISPLMALQLITDNHFQAGLTVLDTNRVVQGDIHWPTNATDTPCWMLAQWFTHGSVYGCTPTNIAPGEGRWANSYKAIFMGTNSDYGDIRLTVNSKSEYSHVYRDGTVKDFPHLLVEQRICLFPDGFFQKTKGICLSELTELRFKMKAKLIQANNLYVTNEVNGTYNPTRHAAQFQLFFTVDNLDKNSRGFRDFYYFGIDCYDDRRSKPSEARLRGDAATGKGIYWPGLSAFSTNIMHVGDDWVVYDRDILNDVKAGLNECWENGFLANDFVCTNIADRYAFYKIGSVNVGWEVPGLGVVSAQIQDLGLEAYGLYFPRPYEYNTDGNMEGWVFSNMTDIGAPGPRNGKWLLSVPGTEPKLTGPAIRVDADTFTKVKVRIANDGNPIEASSAQLFWKRSSDTDFSQGRSKKVAIDNSGEWIEYTFDMAADPEWDGEIVQLQLDPVCYGDGHNVGVDYIRFSR